jgi:hypothetical protein
LCRFTEVFPGVIIGSIQNPVFRHQIFIHNY